MAIDAGFRRLKRTLVIHVVVQLFLLALLVFMALNFQNAFRAKGVPQVFLNSILTSLVIQLALFYPINRFAAQEARREVAACAGGLGAEELTALRRKRIFGDFLKGAAFIFFATFIAMAPGVTFVMSTAFFCFILVTLTYFQCFNHAARRAMKERDDRPR
jgi:hypothetical protein